MSLFEPIQVGDLHLQHHVVLPPLQRLRPVKDGAPNGHEVEYYRQRAQEPGTLLIAGALAADELIPDKNGNVFIPGISTKPQIKGWQRVTGAIHKQKSFAFLQLWTIGHTLEEGGAKVFEQPNPSVVNSLSTKQVKRYVDDYVKAAENAIAAGFDGVEIHGAYGYLLNQFLHDSNHRQDEYGGSIENRCRIYLEVLDAVSTKIGAHRTSLRISPSDAEFEFSFLPVFAHLLAELERRKQAGSEFAYVHVVEDRKQQTSVSWFLRRIWSGVLIRAGGYDLATASETVHNDEKTLIAFGRWFISNPDLVVRLRDGLPLEKYDRSTFYSGETNGYTDYKNYDGPPSKKTKKSNKRKFILNAFVMDTPNHLSPGLWRHPTSATRDYKKLEYWTELAKLLDDAGFHSMFIADTLGPYDVYKGPQNFKTPTETGSQFPVLDPSVVITAMAAVTKRLSFGLTTSTTYEHPYTVARRFSSLDHYTNGRIIWNIVTSYLDSAARLYGLPEQIEHDERYKRADEFLQVCYKLWESSWKEDAVTRGPVDKDTPYADPDKVREISHEGEYFNVHGVHISEPSPQRTPLLFQAGTSKRGSEFGALNSEMLFISGFNMNKTAETVAKLRAQAKELGRHSLKIVSSIAIIVAETDELAQKKYEEYLSYADVEGALTLFGGWTGYDLSKYDDDEDFRFVSLPAVQSTVLSIDDTHRWTKSEIARQLILGGFGAKLVGSTKTVVDQLEAWADTADLDGFNLVHITSPGTFEDLIKYVIPELKKRGRFREDSDVTGASARKQVFGQDHVLDDHPAYQYKWN